MPIKSFKEEAEVALGLKKRKRRLKATKGLLSPKEKKIQQAALKVLIRERRRSRGSEFI